MTHDSLSSEFDPLDAPAEEFLSRFRRGEQPALSEYESRYPELADRIRVLFPALLEMESIGNQQAEADLITAFGRQQRVPARIGEFRILRKVGEGGMGVVYEAMQESLGRHVALKVLPHDRERKYLERFRREARAAAKLHHTNIVPVFGVGEADGLHFYAMQFIPGQGLDRVLDEVLRLRSARHPGGSSVPHPNQTRTAVAGSVAEGLLTGDYAPAAPPPDAPSSSLLAGSAGSHTELANQPEARYYREIARIGVQVAEALAHAHEQGVLHRDIKPSNLLLDLHGMVWVTDFGLAKADDEGDLTRTGDIVGTLRYMAPERFRGKSDVASEVYSLGATLYELLTLRSAFPESDRVALIERVCHCVPVRPRKLDRQIPRDLETIVLKAMARDPADRYHTAAAMAEDLRRFLADRSITARRASPPEQLRRWARRNKAVAALLSVLFLSAVSAAIVFAVQGQELRAALNSSEKDRRDLIISQKESVRQEREARLRRLDSMIAEARGKTLGRRPGQRFESLARLDEGVALARELDVLPSRADDLRNAFAAALAVPDIHIARSWDGFPKGTVHFDFNEDHTVYARTNDDGTCVVAQVADNDEICRVPFPSGPDPKDAWQVHLSGDGRSLLLICRGGEAHVWRIGGGPPKRVLSLPDSYFGDMRRDDKVAAVSHTDGSISIIDLQRETPRSHRLVAAVVGQSRVVLWDLDTGRVGAELPIEPDGSYQPVFDRRGAMWTSSGNRPRRWPIREDSARPGEFTIGPAEWIDADFGGLARSADDRVWIGVHRARSDAFIWKPAKPFERESLPTGKEQGHVNLSPDGCWATTSNFTTHDADLWDVRTRRKVKRLYSHGDNAIPAFSPDGKLLWVNSDGGQLLHVGTWEPGPKTGRAEGRPAFTADSKIIALETGAGTVRLLETATGRELVRLDNPHQDPLFDLAFTPDGGRLLGASPGKHADGIHVWELRRIRKHLADRGLDWDTIPLAPPRVHPSPLKLKRLTTEVASLPQGEADLRAGRWAAAVNALANLPTDPAGRTAALLHRSVAYDQLRRHDEAQADRAALSETYFDLGNAYLRSANRHSLNGDRTLARAFNESAVRTKPDDLIAMNNLAWSLAMGPAAAQDPKRALPLALRAAAARNDLAIYQNTLGCIYYRLGRYDEAIETLKRSLQLGDERSAVGDRYLLALCRYKKGDTRLAYTEFVRAAAGHLRWRRHFNPVDALDLNDLAEECVFVLFVPSPR
jgi:serine/threonine protein kinase/WD40 repeat protein